MKDNIIQEKSFAFAVRAVKAYKYIATHKKEYVLSKQFLKSATSVGANVEEAIGAQSKPDFISKLSIAYKEGRESHYWIRLLQETEYLNHNEANSLLSELEEILKIISRIKMTSLNNLKK
jgi:four helix bundle protein